jgi:activating signal cointegrator 1
MRALTLTQPWAGLVASGIKLVENRPRRMIKREDFGKPFAIHASREIDDAGYETIARIAPDVLVRMRTPNGGIIDTVPCFRDWYRLSRDTSAVIAVAVIDRVVEATSDYDRVDDNEVDRIRADIGDQARWFFGPVGYVLRDVRALAKPVPCRGWQGFWTLDPWLASCVMEQLR